METNFNLQKLDSLAKFKLKYNRNNIYFCRITDIEVSFIVGLRLNNLKTLELGPNKITVKGLQILFQGSWPKLEKFYIWDNNLKDHGIQTILLSQHVKNFKTLHITNCNYKSSGLKKFIGFQSNTILHLNLSKNNIGSQGVGYLVKANLGFLRQLVLCKNVDNQDSCHIGSEGFKNLIKSLWPSLISIDLRYNYLQLEGYSQASGIRMPTVSDLKLSHMPRISVLKFYSTNLGTKLKFPDSKQTQLFYSGINCIFDKK